MATWYTDVANVQQPGNNFPGASGQAQLAPPPFVQNNALFEGGSSGDGVIATYTWTGNEVANDIINICIAGAGAVVSPNGHVSSGLTAPSSTLTFAVGDNDLGLAANLPIPNVGSAQAALGYQNTLQAPAWVSGTTYVQGNVVLDPNSTPANLSYTCVTATTSGTTAPHSAANTVWMPNNQRYSNSIDVHAASGNVAFAGGTQNYGGPASVQPYSTTPGQVALGFTGAQVLNQPYQIQNDCWLQAIILTINATAINANAVSIFRVGLGMAN